MITRHFRILNLLQTSLNVFSAIRYGRLFLINIILFILVVVIGTYQILQSYEVIQIPIFPKTLRVYRQIAIPSLSEAHLFGQPAIMANNSNLVVRGIVYINHQHSFVVLADNNIEHIYHEGDRLPDGTIISKIQTDSILIVSNGTTRTLLIPWNIQGFSNNQPVQSGTPFSMIKEP